MEWFQRKEKLAKDRRQECHSTPCDNTDSNRWSREFVNSKLRLSLPDSDTHGLLSKAPQLGTLLQTPLLRIASAPHGSSQMIRNGLQLKTMNPLPLSLIADPTTPPGGPVLKGISLGRVCRSIGAAFVRTQRSCLSPRTHSSSSPNQER
jgi:hypothetical protein